ncbi:uncharacterized protein [Paramisgurnus dabryanus]|uniref:uncharacterized protein n=1 Tax=Paramisgurnus dabryanus TaxID=90735 RepID=UPI003CCF7139
MTVVKQPLRRAPVQQVAQTHRATNKTTDEEKRSSLSSRAAMFFMRDQMDVMCCKSVGTDLSMLDIDDLMTEISQLKKEVALLESKLRQRDELNTKDVSGVCLCGFTDQTSTELLVSVCNDEDQKTSVNLLDCGMKAKQEVTEEQIDEGGLIYSDLIVKEESSPFSIMEEKPQHFIPKEESMSSFMTEKNLSPKNSIKLKTTTEDPFMCPQCGKIFSNKYKLKAHMSIHSGDKPYKCDQCGKCFNIRSYLNVHMNIHNGEKRHTCAQCGKIYIHKQDLTVHMRHHTGEKPFRCDQCGKSFIRKAYLDFHMRHHTGEKPYSCDQCGKSFIRKYALNRHIRIHTGEKLHRCDECGKSFDRKYYLKLHMRRHTGEKPFTCDHCGKGFTIISSLKAHMKIHTRLKNVKT